MKLVRRIAANKPGSVGAGLLLLGSLAFVAVAAHATVMPLQVSTNVNTVTSTVTFSILFDKVPDFTTTDAAGRQADSFQFYIDSLGPSTPHDFVEATALGGGVNAAGKSIIRGDGIHFGNGLPLIWIDPTDAGPPENGGWGPTKTDLPFNLSGTLLSFDVSFADLQDSDGVFWYLFGTFAYGSGVCGSNGASPLLSGEQYTTPDICFPSSAPEPATLALLGIGLAGLGLARRRKQ